MGKEATANDGSILTLFQFHGRGATPGVSCPLPLLPGNRSKRATGSINHAHSPGLKEQDMEEREADRRKKRLN